MIDEKQMMAEIKGTEDLDAYRKRYCQRYPLYEQYSRFILPEWSDFKHKNMMKFDGSGLYKWPAAEISGKMTIPMMDMHHRWKMATNVWRDTYFFTAKMLTDTLGLEKATELMSYIWIGLAASMTAITKRFLKGKAGDCVTFSKTFQMENLVEGVDFDILDERPERFAMRQQCPWWADFKSVWEPLGVDIREPLCNVGCTGWAKEWANMVNPKIKFQKTKYIGDGDDCCEFVFEITD